MLHEGAKTFTVYPFSDSDLRHYMYPENVIQVRWMLNHGVKTTHLAMQNVSQSKHVRSIRSIKLIQLRPIRCLVDMDLLKIVPFVCQPLVLVHT